MILLVSGATRTLARYPEAGRLITPRNGNSIELLAGSSRTWAADNDCFQRLDVDAYWRMIVRISKVDRERLMWVAVPDVVGDAQATVNRWVEWFPQLEYLDLPTAFVGQDGLEDIADQIPWDEMSCFFVGGSTEWKLSEASERFCREAKTRGKLVHFGRVNTRCRIRDVLMMVPMVDSIDGTTYSRWPDKYLPLGLGWIRQAKQQACLF